MGENKILNKSSKNVLRRNAEMFMNYLPIKRTQNTGFLIAMIPCLWLG